MLPLQQAYETKEAIIEYLKATFGFKDKSLNDAFYNFIEDDKNGVVHEPYISLKTPFTSAECDGSNFLDIVPGYILYKHQYLSFERLSTHNQHSPQPTLLTTGTGSGKTECFLYPLLDYCYQWKRNKESKNGVKAIILYPMNALASDQAKRLAEAIYSDKRLKGNITAGLFIGTGKNKDRNLPATMGEHNIIEDNIQILQTPPDIILTNFKMLDYALMRNDYSKLWNHNFENQTMLKFLVLDELHTYDGAQGTDVANLIRRLKLKLNIPQGALCPIGTSATIGSGANSKTLLCKYASEVFGEDFDESSIIVEDRIPIEKFIDVAQSNFIPSLLELEKTKFLLDDNYEKYIDRLCGIWKVNQQTLAADLSNLQIVRDLVDVTSDSYLTVGELIAKLSQNNNAFDSLSNANVKILVLSSLLALITTAQKGTIVKFPFLYLQVQLWLRELSGLLRVVSNDIKFTWKKDVSQQDQTELALPTYFCRECGTSGWIGYKPQNSQCLEVDPGKTAQKFLANHENCYLINLYAEEHKPINEYNGSYEEWWLDPNDLHIYNTQGGDKNRVHVYAAKKVNNSKIELKCPLCCSQNTLAIIGTKVATLASVAISQIMSSDLDNEDEFSRKVLAFTNSVQDAAHQAGFFEARNYRFSFRNALQNCIRNLRVQNKLPISLADLENEFVTYWKDKCNFSVNQEEYVYRFFPPDKIGDFNLETDYRQSKTKFKNGFIEQLDKRLGWEIVSEFGFNARIGRTLEKSGASATYFEENKLHIVFEKISPWLKDNNLGKISSKHFIQFTNGILHRMRIKGAVDHEFLTKFREDKSITSNISSYYGNSVYYLSRNFGARSRYPKLVTTDRLSSNSILESTYVTRVNNWYKQYFNKCFGADLFENEVLSNEISDSLYNDFFKKFFDILCDVQLCNKSKREHEQNYCILPSAIMISDDVKHINCHRCTSIMCVANQDEISEDTFCIDYNCKGKYTDVKKNDIHKYYYNVYNRELAPRIFSHEHTGILNRQKRETIEFKFKGNEKKNSINTLVATSTLEMGIDIGDLNVALNTAIPPMPSNFIQRVGRAGRKSGAALIIDFARNEYHDLFYYAEPKEMMQGKINTPGCYLSAVDILRRHFFAFCIDTWTGLDATNHNIPSKVWKLPMATFKTDKSSFYNQILDFVTNNGKSLISSFRSQYTNEQGEALNELELQLQRGEFINRIVKEFEKLYNKYMDLGQRIKDALQYIKDENLPETGEERKEIENQIKILWRVKCALQQQQVLEFMTNAGLLPNYAFPETGVNLSATIIHKHADDKSKYQIDEIELQRPATMALRELAPGNYFYSQKYRMKVTGLSTLDWNTQDDDSLMDMRFCSKCDYITLEDDVTKLETKCPKCGSQSYATANNVHKFVRIRDVRSNDDKESAMLNDNKDERENTHYATSKHFIFDGGSVKASGLLTIPFGIEYCKSVNIWELNLGLYDQNDARSIDINEIEKIPQKGFVTCRYCGKSTSKMSDLLVDESKKLHYGFCKHKDKKYNGRSDDYFEEVFLYHNFHSEAIKVLLPVQEIDTEETLDMFEAGLHLGLRDYFEGNPDHIKIDKYKAYNEQTGKFDRYVVLYDTIPGGTGYLAKISQPLEFEKILQNAWNRIHTCDCQNQGKDGCYHCIYTYANQRIHNRLSRTIADRLFRKILDSCYDVTTGNSNWEDVKGLGMLSSDGGLEESELETRFIHVLEKYTDNDVHKHWKFSQSQTSYKQQYSLEYADGNHRICFEIIPQYVLDKSKGVQSYTEPDFLIRPNGMQEFSNNSWNNMPFDHLKKIAIYLDGYKYHASDIHNVFEKDFQKRRSIENSKEYMSLTFTWDDLTLFENGDINTSHDSIIERQDNSILPTLEQQRKAVNLWRTQHNSMQRLLFLLSNLWQPSVLKENMQIYLLGLQPAVTTKYELFPEQPWAKIVISIDKKNKDIIPEFTVPTQKSNLALDKDLWRNFWQAYNLVSIYEGLNDGTKPPQPAATTAQQYETIASQFDDSLHDIIIDLLNNNIDFNHTAGVEIFDTNGKKVCEAELVSEKHKFLFYADDDDAVKQLGYTIYETDTFNINKLI